jgi:cobalt/nickel transport system permease protein
MHVPDGFIDAPTLIVADVIAIGGVAYAVRQGAKELDDKHVPLAGLVAAFIFAVQMLNFPVASGTSGHLLGGVLAAVLVGPWLGVLAVSVVLFVQALLFADGGLTALGLNITLMAVIAGLGGYAIFRALRGVLPKSTTGVVVASGIAAGLSVVLAAAGFTIAYEFGGQGSASTGTVFAAMVGVHTLIGIGEGIITALTVGAVMATRPDLVYGARDLEPTIELRTSGAPA